MDEKIKGKWKKKTERNNGDAKRWYAGLRPHWLSFTGKILENG
jgi:hypothetical protein